ncbi:MAG: hypothetical protein AAGD06_28420 [Acidobacteriota bacterium]
MPHPDLSIVQRELRRLAADLETVDRRLATLAAAPADVGDPLAMEIAGVTGAVRTDLLADAIATVAALGRLDRPTLEAERRSMDAASAAAAGG